ncbi:MAG: T9SS type A sorting domain-containing protein [Bacteroidota bacterium]
MKRVILGLLAILATCGSTKAQNIISVEAQEEVSLGLLEFILQDTIFDYGISSYKVIYTGEDPFGDTDTLSGLLVLPQVGDDVLELPMLAYMHGTAAAVDQVPSEEGVEERFLPYAFAAEGYIAVAPDYLGYGVDSLELHPYVHADTEAKSGRDLLLAAREWLDDQGIGYNDQVFTTGYSQGGHASAALQKLVEADSDSELTITAASHLSGPYAISQAMVEAVTSAELTTFPSYVVFTYLGYNYVYDLYDDDAAIFVEPYLSTIDSFAQNQIDLIELNTSLFLQLSANGETLDGLFQDSILTILQSGDSDHPLIAALEDNDLFNFVPQAPTRLYYCTLDEQVPFQNALLADTTMNNLGAEDVASINGGPEDHGGCIRPAVNFTIEFFGQFQQILSSTKSPELIEADWQLVPNPIAMNSTIRLIAEDDPPTNYELFDLSGRQLANGFVPVDGQMSIAGLPRGTYVVKLIRDNQFLVRRLIVR